MEGDLLHFSRPTSTEPRISGALFRKSVTRAVLFLQIPNHRGTDESCDTFEPIEKVLKKSIGEVAWYKTAR